MKATSLIVVGTPFSGAAVLGHMLGAHSQVFFAGELWRHWDRTAQPGERDCRGCGPECATWGAAAVRATIANGPAAMSAALAETTGRRVIVEGPASSSWLEVRIADGVPEGEDVRIVLCVCDPVLYARKRAGVTPEYARRRAVEWRDEQQALVRATLSSGRPVLVVHYENLIEAADETLARVCVFAGLEAEATPAAWWETPTHALGAASEKWGVAVRAGTRPSPQVETDPLLRRVDTLSALDRDPVGSLGLETVRALITEIRPTGLYETFGYEPVLPPYRAPQTEAERVAMAGWVRRELRRTRESVLGDRAPDAIVTLKMLADHFGPAFDDLRLELDYENLAIVLVDLLNGQHRYAEALPHVLRLVETCPHSPEARRLLAITRAGAGIAPADSEPDGPPAGTAASTDAAARSTGTSAASTPATPAGELAPTL